MINTSSPGQPNQDGASSSRATNRRPARRARSGARRSGGLHLSKVDARAAAAVALELIENPKRGGEDDGDSSLSSPLDRESKPQNEGSSRPGIADSDRPESYRSVLDYEDDRGGASAPPPPVAGPCKADGPFTASAADAPLPRAPRILESCLSPAANDEDGDINGKRRRKSRHVSFSQQRVRVYESRTSFVGIGWRYNPREIVEAILDNSRETVEAIGSPDGGGGGEGRDEAAAAGRAAPPFENLKDLKDLDIKF